MGCRGVLHVLTVASEMVAGSALPGPLPEAESRRAGRTLRHSRDNGASQGCRDLKSHFLVSIDPLAQAAGQAAKIGQKKLFCHEI